MSIKRFNVNRAFYDDGVTELGHSWRNVRMSLTYYYSASGNKSLDVTLQARRERCGNGVVNHTFTYNASICMIEDRFPVIRDQPQYLGPNAKELVSDMPLINGLLADPKALIDILNDIGVFKTRTDTEITDPEKVSWAMAQLGGMLGDMVAEAAKQRDTTAQDSTETIELQAYVFADATPVQVEDEPSDQPLAPKPDDEQPDDEQPDELARTDAAESTLVDETDAE
jgi:hypothetical protein